MNDNKKRPVYLNIFLLLLHMPVTAILSIGHRISGVLLFLAIPLLFYLFDLSLGGEIGFMQVKQIWMYGAAKLAVFVMFWAFIHHLFAGLRFFFIDVDIGLERQSARISAWFVHVGEVIVLFTVMGILL